MSARTFWREKMSDDLAKAIKRLVESDLALGVACVGAAGMASWTHPLEALGVGGIGTGLIWLEVTDST